MKIRDLIRLIVLVLVVAFLGLWAFGALEGVTIGTTRFLRWDSVYRKGADTGAKYVAIYKISAPDEAESFDVEAATRQAAAIFEKRLNAVGAEGTVVRQMGLDAVWVELPGATSANEVNEILHNRGEFKVALSDSEDVLFNNDDVTSVKMLGYDSTTQLVYVDVQLREEAKERLANLTGPGSASMKVTMDGTEVSTTYSSSQTVTNGVMRLSFSTSNYSQAVILSYCVDSGMISGKVTLDENNSMQIEASAGMNAGNVFGIAALAVLALAMIYFILSGKLLGVSASLSLLIAVIALDFFGATFSWLQTDLAGVAGFGIAILILVMAHMAMLFAIKRQYALGKGLVTSLDDAVNGISRYMLELLAIPAVIGIGLWICGGVVKPLGITMFGSALLAMASSLLLIRHIAKIFIGIGLTNSAAYGLKRGE